MRETTGYDTTITPCVSLIDTFGNDAAVCDAARVSFAKKASEYTEHQNERLIKYLAAHDHWSPFAHCMLKFRFRAPIFVARQFQKHVVGFAWNEVSRRYVDDPPTFFIPCSFRKRPDNVKQGSVTEDETPVEGVILEEYESHIREHTRDYKSMISQGICPEQARMFMPQSMITEWIWTGSLVAWARFVKLRSHSHAQQECWPYADEVQGIMETKFPISTRELLEITY